MSDRIDGKTCHLSCGQDLVFERIMSSDGSPCELLSQILWHNGFAYAIRHLPQAEDALLLVHSYCPIRTKTWWPGISDGGLAKGALHYGPNRTPDKRKAPTELRMAAGTS